MGGWKSEVDICMIRNFFKGGALPAGILIEERAHPIFGSFC